MSAFDRLETLQDNELKDLVAVAVEVLLSSEDLPSGLPEDLASISPRAASREIAACLPPEPHGDTARAVQRALQDSALSRDLSILALREIGRDAGLAAMVETAFSAREKQLAVAELTLLTGALVVLSMRIKRLRWSKNGFDVSFDKASQGVHDVVLSLLKRISF
jgi:hypothetical protein